TPVLIYDDTADRTLNGVSGPIRDLSLSDWESATIKHPKGGSEAATVTLDEMHDERGGEVVTGPDIKPGATSAEADRALDRVDAGDLRGRHRVGGPEHGAAEEPPAHPHPGRFQGRALHSADGEGRSPSARRHRRFLHR